VGVGWYGVGGGWGGGERERAKEGWDGGNYISTSKDATERTDSYSTELPYDIPIPSAIRC